MKNQLPNRDAGKGVKNNSNTVQKPISTRYLTGAALVLLGAFVIGMVIREFRFWSSGQKHLTEDPKVVQKRDITKIRQAPKEPEIQNTREHLPIKEVFIEPELLAPDPVSPPPTTIVDGDGQSNTETQAEMAAESFGQDSFNDDPQAKERRARIALGMIGHDPDADEVWIRLINDPILSANARSNLIEDLNEDGLSYRNLTLDDLPVIEYRLELIEDLLPYAMDEVNEDAFKEARKDIENMADRLRQQ